jgi:hypothetical protein
VLLFGHAHQWWVVPQKKDAYSEITAYSAFGKYSGPLTFVKLQLYSKMDKFNCFFPPSSIYTQYPIMTKQKHVLIFLCKCIMLKYHIYIYVFRPFTQYFVEAPLAATTVLSLLGYDASSLAHLYVGSFSNSSLHPLKLCQVGWGLSRDI